MTLLDLCALLKRNLWLVIALPIVCAVICFGVLTVMPAKYAATATLFVSDDIGVVGTTASTVGEQLSEGTGLKVSVSSNATNKAVTVKAEGGNAVGCVELANQIAEESKNTAYDFFGRRLIEESETMVEAVNGEGSTATDEASMYALMLAEQDRSVTVTVSEAIKAVDTSPSRVKYSLVALLGGLFLAICIIVIRDMVRGSVHNSYEVEENYDLRQLGRMHKPSARRRSEAAAEDASLLAALDFAAQGKRAICLVPMENSESAKRVVTALEAVAETVGKRIGCIGETANLTLSDPAMLANAITAETPPGVDLTLVMAPAVADSADFAYLAPACGCAVIVIEAMRTKRTHLEAALNQLALSQTDVAGFIMVNGA